MNLVDAAKAVEFGALALVFWLALIGLVFLLCWASVLIIESREQHHVSRRS